jgi:DNA-binding MarR family transcriptional regulator
MALISRQGHSNVPQARRKFAAGPLDALKLIFQMAKAGLVERRTDIEDQRVSRVYLTGEGWALREPVEEIWHELEEQSMVNLTLDERILLRRLLLQVYENLT